MQTDKEEFSKLMQENKGIVFKVCNSYCSNKNDIEDLAQEIIFQLWKSYSNYNASYKFTTWMYKIALNTAISFYRKVKKTHNTISFEEHLIEIADNNEAAINNQNINLLQHFINELKELDKALMILYLEEKTYKEIAEIIGITETNVATKINRIKEKLKQKFSTYNL